MKLKKFLLRFSSLVILIISSSVLFAAEPEDFLTARPDDSIYTVMKLEDAGEFFRWLLSEENLKIINSLNKSAEEYTGLASIIVKNMPLKSVALVAGVNSNKINAPFFQCALNLNDSSNNIIRKISTGDAGAKDIAALILGAGNPLSEFAETMLKVEKEAGEKNIYKINNAVYLRTDGEFILISLAVDELRNSGVKFFDTVERKTAAKNFIISHVDGNVLKQIEESSQEVFNMFNEPLHIETGCEVLPNKFIMSTFHNTLQALKKEIAGNYNLIEPVIGGNINLNPSGNGSPLLALGAKLFISRIKDFPETETFWKRLTRNFKKFGITEDEILKYIDGAYSLNISGTVPFMGFKIPGIYLSHQAEGINEIFNKLSKSENFSSVQNNLLQLDSSFSPMPLVIGFNPENENLTVAISEVSGFGGKPEIKPELNNLLDKKSISALWLDFDGLKSWLNDNGIIAMLAPMAMIAGKAEIIEIAQEILSAEFSVPSVSVNVESQNKFNVEFNLKDINPEKGILNKAANLYKKYAK